MVRMTPSEREPAYAAFKEPQGMGYIRSFNIEGETFWALFDDIGRELVASSNRSSTFFFAAENDITVRMLN